MGVKTTGMGCLTAHAGASYIPASRPQAGLGTVAQR